MRDYQFRLLSGALLAGLVLRLAIPGAALTVTANQRQDAAEALVNDDPALPADALPQDGLVASLTGPAGTVCTLLDAEQTALRVLCLDEDGLAATPALSPGVYGLQFRDGAVSSFTLQENGALQVAAGDENLWTDGEILHLTADPTGVVTVKKSLSAATADFSGLDPTFFYTLETPDGQQLQQVLAFYDTLPLENGIYTQSVQFTGLSAGTYRLTENDGEAMEIEISAAQWAVTVELASP